MVKAIVQNRLHCNQAVFSKDGKMDSYDSFIVDIIREYGKFNSNHYTLFASDLPVEIQRLFLHYILDEDSLDDLAANPSLYNAYLREYRDDLQAAIDSRADDVFREFMEEAGKRLCVCRETGEHQYI